MGRRCLTVILNGTRKKHGVRRRGETVLRQTKCGIIFYPKGLHFGWGLPTCGNCRRVKE